MPGESSDNGISIAICCIGKPGSESMTDWINHHLELGFDHIFIYNNGTLNGFKQALEANPIDGVEIVDFQYNHEKEYTVAAYADCYRNHKDEYDWMAFWEPDEFLILKRASSIKSVLNSLEYRKFEVVRVNIVQFTNHKRLVRDLDLSSGDNESEKPSKDKKIAKSIVNCRAKGLWMGEFCPRRNRDIITQCLPNLEPVGNDKRNDTIKGVGVDKVDTSIMYLTPNHLEVLWVNWKRGRGYDKNSREAVMARGTPTFQRYKHVIPVRIKATQQS